MYDSTPSLISETQPDNERSTLQPEMFRRTFQCGHPEEFIECQQDDNGDKVHNLITLEMFEDIRRRFGDLPAYLQARCLNCAKVAKEKDDKDPKVRPKRTLGRYQAASLSAMTTKAEGPLLTGFEGILNEHNHRDDQATAVQPHQRVSEDEYRVHRLDMQVKAVQCAGKWLAVPARRVWNMPIQTKVAVRPASRPQGIFRTDSIEDTDRPTGPGEYTGEDDADFVKGHAEILRTHISKGKDESFRVAAVNTISSSGSKLERQKKNLEAIAKSDTWDPRATNSFYTLSDQATEAHRVQHALEAALPRRESAFRDCLTDQYQSLLDELSNSSLANQRFEHPRPAPGIPLTPVSPKKSALDFVKRRSSTSTKRSAKSKPRSMNFRKLGVDVHSARSIKKADLDSDSPDWACQTSLAIESGRIPMDSVSKQSRESMKSKHIAGTQRSPDERRNTYPSPSGNRSPTSSRYVRRSEGAPHTMRASAARGSGALVGMEIASPQKESVRRDSAQVAPVIDLNKSLPALPLQDSDNDAERSVELG